MTSLNHLVLGGNGIIGRETIRALQARGITPTSVGRRVSAGTELPSVIADLLVAADAKRALQGAEVAYLVAGLPYSSRIWQQQWPRIVHNTIDAALEQGTHLVYLDNVYAYGLVQGSMSEATPIRPCSKKGRVRAEALELLDTAVERGLSLTVARSADFYGPGATTSVFNGFVLDRIAVGKRPTWMLYANLPHSLTYTPDIGNALALLGSTEQVRGTTWHLPTAPAHTGREYIEIAGGTDFNVMRSSTLRIGAVFNSAARETLEMSYEHSSPYVFDSSLFERTFGVAPTPIEVGIAETLAQKEDVK